MFRYWNTALTIIIEWKFYSRYFTTEELAAILEQDDFWADFERADVFITPPEDGVESEEDSGDENDIGSIDNFSGRQLRAKATLKLSSKDDSVNIGEESDEENDIPLSDLRKKLLLKSLKRKWSKIDLQPNLRPFLSPKEKKAIPSDPVACFELFFDEEVFEFLQNMFIVYAKSKGDYSFNISIPELKCYIAILLLSGYLDIPRWRMLWECDTETYNITVANAMRRNRFEQIKKYTHCANNDNLASDDKFAKVRPLFNLLNTRFLEYAELAEHLSIDESMVPYFGRHSAKQFIRGKPIRYGYKMWCLCDHFGYLMQFEPYQGKQSNRQNMDLGVGGSVVMNLLSKLPRNVSFKIYGDRYFSSLKLVNRLQEIGYGYTGTIMANRIEKCPITSIKTMEKRDRGAYDFCTDTNTGITVTEWNDNRVVLTVSSCDSVEPIGQANRWVSSEKKKVPVSQPYVISAYNKYMGGVDRMDENIDRYRISIRSKKWWWAPFAFCIDTSIHNAWQLYRKNAEQATQMDFLQFRRTIVQVYLKKYGNPVIGGGRPKSSKELQSRVLAGIRYDRVDHWMVPADKQNRCAFCKKNSTKKCEKCEVNLHEGCFKIFHIN